ncbi:MAG TPA: carboxylesterase family protein [Byssovorax sp.]|jgi:para-nitrobenzyl esterase
MKHASPPRPSAARAALLALVALAAAAAAQTGCGSGEADAGVASTTEGTLTGAGGATSTASSTHTTAATSTTTGAGGAGGAPLCPVAPSDDPLVAPTKYGLVQGKMDGATLAFLGVPYAAPPTGDLRLRPPTEPACWDGARDATDFGSACSQILPNDSSFGSEDCLYLNVWTPSRSSATRPVMFFVHGGAYLIGSGSQDLVFSGTGDLYDGQTLADENDAVVVTINYRLGELGFLAHPSLTSEDPNGSSGNYGVLDQIAALTWVKENIASFGGDPANVMLFGESAGGLSTCLLLSSPLAQGLFAKALIESGGCTVASQDARYTQGRDIVDQLGCTSAADIPACLRAAPAAAFDVPPPTDIGQFLGPDGDITSVWDMPFGPNIDDYVFKEQPLDAMKAGRHAKVPLVVGSNSTEFRLFMPPGTINTCADYWAAIDVLFGDLADDVIHEYDCFDKGLPYDTAVAVGTDFMFTCTARRTLRAALQGGTPVAYRYYDSHGYTLSPLSPLGAFHASELPFVFRTFDVFGYQPTSGDTALSLAMSGYWGRFAQASDPNGALAFAWPTYDPQADVALQLDDAISTTSDIESAHCDFWDSLVGP